jgi:hypothetical protein
MLVNVCIFIPVSYLKCNIYYIIHLFWVFLILNMSRFLQNVPGFLSKNLEMSHFLKKTLWEPYSKVMFMLPGSAV